MSITEIRVSGHPPASARCTGARDVVTPPTRDLQRTFQLALATIWLLDAVLQLQPIMFTPGSNGFSAMLRSQASGNPSWIAHSITWNASIVDHHPVSTNALFALIQFLIGFGIVSPRTLKPALGLSIVWSLAVWWFGEGLGRLFSGGATPFGGGPGGVLFYALLAVLLWPRARADQPFVAARAVGVHAAKTIWVALWALLALLSLLGSGRSPRALRDLVAGVSSGEPGWLGRIDVSGESFLLHHGTSAAMALAVVCLLVGAGVFLPPRLARATVVLAIVVFAVIWVAVQNFGGILARGATDPNAALLVIVLALMYWPLTNERATSPGGASGPALAARDCGPS
jgi:hypothetical protein